MSVFANLGEMTSESEQVIAPGQHDTGVGRLHQPRKDTARVSAEPGAGYKSTLNSHTCSDSVRVFSVFLIHKLATGSGGQDSGRARN